ncbi:MAG: cation transporter [Deltaproteobacteria bacterium]|nr:cation transporter [Deltaproteobacteria bacterium]
MKKILLGTLLTLIFTGVGIARPSFADTLYVVNVKGMVCDMCPAAIKKSISEVPGTEWVFTSLRDKVAVVVAKDGVKKDAILDAVQKASKATGHEYKAQIVEEKQLKD